MGEVSFSLALMVSGLWLVLRNFERIPQFAVERILGIILLIINLLAILHLLGLSTSEESAQCRWLRPEKAAATWAQPY